MHTGKLAANVLLSADAQMLLLFPLNAYIVTAEIFILQHPLFVKKQF